MTAEPDFRALFLGAHGEQDEAFERLLVDHVREHFAWRREFHPGDQGVRTGNGAAALEERTRAELQRLIGALRRSVPVSSPRYLGHMTSDLLMPGVLAQMVTTLYNPNNVTSEVAPVTVGMEHAAAAQLAAMIGFDGAEDAPRRAWGHLTSGGTVANIESLWMARAARCWPVAVARARGKPQCPGLDGIAPEDGWRVLNLSIDEVHDLHRRVGAWLDGLPVHLRAAAMEAIEEERIERVGAARYPAMSVLVPVTAHYSWEKAVKLLGMGTDRLVPVAVTERMRMDPGDLEDKVLAAHAKREAILAVVPVLGTTEYGTIDPVHEVVALRERCRVRGQSFWVHCDAAWGGYLASVFRREDGGLRSWREARQNFRFFPSEEVHAAFAALGDCDSVTVDPHKQGYIPFGAGALLLRDRRCRAFVAQDAPYVFDGDAVDELGRYALEGSRPGAMAAAVCITHRVLPLHAGAFGRLPAGSVRACESLFTRLRRLAARLRGVASLSVPFEPDTNLVCVAVNPEGNAKVSVMNAFMRDLYGQLSVDPSAPRQDRDFYVSRTRVRLDHLALGARARLLATLGLDEVDDGHLFLLRHTLMNPWLSAEPGKGLLDEYCAHLEGLVRSRAG